MMFGFLFLFVLVGVGIWWFVQQQQQGGGTWTGPPQQSGPGNDPVQIARMRYARGEITEEEYTRILRTLQS